MKKEILRKREELTGEQVRQYSRAIFASVFELDCYRKAKNVFIYNSFKKEVATGEAIKKMLKEKNVFLPKITQDDRMVAVRISEDTGYKLSRYGILEPEEGEEANKDEIDLCITPGIVFDKFGGRKGYGKAYYDIFLRGTSIYKLGVCYDFQLVDFIPVDLLDVNMDMVVTEKRIIVINCCDNAVKQKIMSQRI
ncbi:MAG: 5-formyltetrahydrofolate cyclo-ligase [Clostridiales bacterium]|nr:5-formyltetrahydrofolate cyclo-ligase [Clostridiales bacterium]